MSIKPVIGITLDLRTNDKEHLYSEYPWYALRRDYAKIISNSDAVAVMITYDSNVTDIMHILDGILISGGDFGVPPDFYNQKAISDNVKMCRERAAYEIELIRYALDIDMPIFGICNGMQVMNVAAGGSLVQDIRTLPNYNISHIQPKPKNKPYHNISINKHSKLREYVNAASISVNSSHIQAVDSLGSGIIVSAYADDGITEAIEIINRSFALGVQWHPEYGTSDSDRKIFHAFVDAAKKFKQSRSL